MASHFIFLLASLLGNRHSSPHCLLHDDNYDLNFNFSQVLDYQNCLAMERLSGISYNNQNCLAMERLSGARFSKVPIINGPGKLSPFTLNIEVSIVLYLTR